jgi:hypothetical protein
MEAGDVCFTSSVSVFPVGLDGDVKDDAVDFGAGGSFGVMTSSDSGHTSASDDDADSHSSHKTNR